MDLRRHFNLMTFLEIMRFKAIHLPNYFPLFSEYFLYQQLVNAPLYTNFNFLNYNYSLKL